MLNPLLCKNGHDRRNNVFVEFDRKNKRIGFATSICATRDVGNVWQRPLTVSPPRLITEPSSCKSDEVVVCPGTKKKLGMVFWVCLGVSALVVM
jgi:hypothetical protein